MPMSEEILDAAILALRAKALEKYARLKEIHSEEITPETVDQICKVSMEMSAYQNAMTNLKTYKPHMLPVAPDEPAPASQTQEEEVEAL